MENFKIIIRYVRNILNSNKRNNIQSSNRPHHYQHRRVQIFKVHQKDPTNT